MTNGSQVAAFERAFAEYVGARYAIALCNGTATLHTALVALGVNPGDRVAVPPLTMSATTIAVLQAGAVPVFCDVDERAWLMPYHSPLHAGNEPYSVPVSLYGLQPNWGTTNTIIDAAQTLSRPPMPTAFTSYSFQASKILPLGEGGMLVTNNEALATRAREFSSLGYRMRADQPRIDPKVLKSPTFARHHSYPAWNYRMNDLTAREGLRWFEQSTGAGPRRLKIDDAKERRFTAALQYRKAIEGCEWLTPQHVPDGWQHDYWTFAVATDTPERLLALLDAVERHGGERPYPAWRLTYDEPAFVYLNGDPCEPQHQDRHRDRESGTAPGDCPAREAYERHGAHDRAGGREIPEGHDAHDVHGPRRARRVGLCPIAESLQPRLLQFQTNDLASAEQNARALRRAIEDLS